mmetsp:Transcript_89391/g.261322  ORF Transcript_89391/g.261322 Transcript_89391/m.261322 type:complete len:540 (-) Transcript_89391:320-1939(-)
MPQDDLWRHVVWSAHDGKGGALQLHRATKVDQLGKTLAVQQDVLRLQVSVCNGPLVQRLEREDEAASVELRLLPVEQTDLPNGAVQFPPCDELGEEIHKLLILERSDNLDYEGVVVLQQDLPLEPQVLLLLLAGGLQPVDALQRILCAARPVLDEFDHAKRSATQDLHHAQVGQGDVCLLQPDPLLQVLEHLAFDDVHEDRLVYHHELRHLALASHRGCPGLVVQQGSLAEVVRLAERPDCPAPQGDYQLTTLNDKELRAGVALLYHLIAVSLHDRAEGVGNQVDVVIWEMPEDVNLPKASHLLVVSQGVLAGVRQQRRQGVRDEEGELAGRTRGVLDPVAEGPGGLGKVLLAETLAAGDAPALLAVLAADRDATHQDHKEAQALGLLGDVRPRREVLDDEGVGDSNHVVPEGDLRFPECNVGHTTPHHVGEVPAENVLKEVARHREDHRLLQSHDGSAPGLVIEQRPLTKEVPRAESADSCATHSDLKASGLDDIEAVVVGLPLLNNHAALFVDLDHQCLAHQDLLLLVEILEEPDAV